MKITLFGGSGFLGHALTAQLTNAGHHVTLVTRDRERVKKLAVIPAVSVAVIDIRDNAALAGVMIGADAVINLVGILHERKSGDFLRVHRDLTQRIVSCYADTCGAVFTPRYIHVSALGAGVDAPSRYQRSKGEAENAVRASKTNWTIFAPSVIFGAGDSFLSMFAGILKLLPPFVPLAMPRAGAQFQPVWVQDVARAITHSLSDPKTFGQRYELGGPNRYSLRQIVKHAGSRLGRNPIVISTPPPFSTLQALALEFIPGGPLMSRDNLASMSVDNVTDAPWPAFAGAAPTAMETITPTYIGDVPDTYARYRKT